MKRGYSTFEPACPTCTKLQQEYQWIESELARTTEVLRIGVRAGDDEAIPEALASVNTAQLLRMRWRMRIREHEATEHPGFWKAVAAS